MSLITPINTATTAKVAPRAVRFGNDDDLMREELRRLGLHESERNERRSVQPQPSRQPLHDEPDNDAYDAGDEKYDYNQDPYGDDEADKPRFSFRKKLAIAGAALLAAVGIPFAAGGQESVGIQRAYHEAAVSDQEFTNSQLTIDNVVYNGGIDPETGLGYIIADSDELKVLTADSETKEFRNSEGLIGCGLDTLAGFVGTHDEMNQRTVDYIFTKGEANNGQTADVLVQVDNRAIDRNHSNLNVKAGATLPDDCTDIPGNIVEGAKDAGGAVVDGVKDAGGAVVDGVKDLGSHVPNPFG